MTVPELKSKDNSLYKLIRLVASQARRAPRDLVLAEGMRSIEEALAAGRKVDAVLCTAEFASAAAASVLLTSLDNAGTRVYRASPRLLKSVSDVQAPQGVVGLVQMPVSALADCPLAPCPLLLCTCGIQDPGNLGTLIRTAAAAGASLVCTSPGTVSARNPKTIRASAGAFFRIPVVEHVALSALLTWLCSNSITPYLTDSRGRKTYTEVDYTRGSAILLGNESRGIEDPISAEMDSIRIPMAPGVESLNVGIAGALVLFEAFRQRSGVKGS
ncbi:MAG TPA: RNA methyltransferase [Acidobacteriota bacterium]|nr:RNA methyltransferase [Acidobacteriota bacterium]